MSSKINKTVVIKKILILEWDMFQKVPTITGKKAPCQTDQKTFIIMRMSQALAWPEEVLESYLSDLISAKNAGRNLMAEKYGHMMKSTDPISYLKLETLLPHKNAEIQDCINGIISLILYWARTLGNDYPSLLASGRPIESSYDTVHIASMETYLRGELMTYGDETLILLGRYCIECFTLKRNYYQEVLYYTAKFSGYSSLAEAETRLRKNG